jgi:signal transduction histidine kinase
MIRKLRNKFILINMCFVMAILLSISAFLAISYYQRNTRGSTFFLENELRRVMQGNPQGGTSSSPQPFSASGDRDRNFRGREQDRDRGILDTMQSILMDTPQRQRGTYMPYAVYRISPDGEVLDTLDRGLTLSEENAAALLSYLPAMPEKEKNAAGFPGASGVFRSYDIRYAVLTAEDGTRCVIFGDISGFSAAFRSFLLSLAGVLLAALALFFLLSFWLARWALSPVEKAWDQQNRFVADASHELKTPITVILANLDILRTHKDETVQSQMRWIRNTREEAERMRELIEDLLFLAKNDASALKEQMSEIDLSDLSEDRALNFEAVAFEKGVSLESSISPGLKVTGNEGQLKQLLTILLDNAVKYADQDGHVKVLLSPCQEKNGKNAARIVVNNTGEPIPPEDLEHIFERFYRADKSRARKEGGYGLGLSIADSIVRLHRGRISCESTKKDGTTFTVTLPCT